MAFLVAGSKTRTPLGLIMTAVAKSFDFFVFYFTLLITPMMFVSGVFYPRTALPVLVQWAAELLPLAHGADLARGLTLGLPMRQPWTDVLVLAAYAGLSLLVAVRLIRRRLLK